MQTGAHKSLKEHWCQQLAICLVLDLVFFCQALVLPEARVSLDVRISIAPFLLKLESSSLNRSSLEDQEFQWSHESVSRFGKSWKRRWRAWRRAGIGPDQRTAIILQRSRAQYLLQQQDQVGYSLVISVILRVMTPLKTYNTDHKNSHISYTGQLLFSWPVKDTCCSPGKRPFISPHRLRVKCVPENADSVTSAFRNWKIPRFRAAVEFPGRIFLPFWPLLIIICWIINIIELFHGHVAYLSQISLVKSLATFILVFWYFKSKLMFTPSPSPPPPFLHFTRH